MSQSRIIKMFQKHFMTFYAVHLSLIRVILDDFAMSSKSSDDSVHLYRCTVGCFCVGTVLIFVGSIFLCSFGFTFVLPYRATRCWPVVLCRVTEVLQAADLCSCGQHKYPESIDYAQSNEDFEYGVRNDCSKVYPCLQVRVTFNISQGDIQVFPSLGNYSSGDVVNGFIYRSWSDAFSKTVSI